MKPRDDAEAQRGLLQVSEHPGQAEIDKRNAKFWNEPCGTTLARSLGIEQLTPENLARFDERYLALYPYLADYVLPRDLHGRKVLDIGLGSGTLGGWLALRGADYHGVDIADEPVGLMRMRLALLGWSDARQAQVRTGSALELPYPADTFDTLYAIGSLHHTGDIATSVNEAFRVLRPSGTAVVMLYNRFSLRQLTRVHWPAVWSRLGLGTGVSPSRVRAMYDASSAGDVAPVVEFSSRRDVRRYFGAFRDVRIRAHNFDTFSFCRGRVNLRREYFLGNVDRIGGLDLYIVATK